MISSTKQKFDDQFFAALCVLQKFEPLFCQLSSVNQNKNNFTFTINILYSFEKYLILASLKLEFQSCCLLTYTSGLIKSV